jgi:hypothetical protein
VAVAALIVVIAPHAECGGIGQGERLTAGLAYLVRVHSISVAWGSDIYGPKTWVLDNRFVTMGRVGAPLVPYGRTNDNRSALKKCASYTLAKNSNFFKFGGIAM